MQINRFHGWVYVLSALVSISSAFANTEVDPNNGKVVNRCKTSKPSKHVTLFKQWHLPPGLSTREKVDSKPLPQEKNQTAIFNQLDQWVVKKQITEVYAEGCVGELDETSNLNLNGWTIADLKSQLKQPNYPQLLASAPMKIEAKHAQGVRTICADDEKLIREGNLALSDARGILGFLTRLEQHKNEQVRAKTYLDGVIELYKLPAKTTVSQAVQKLKTELKSSVQRLKTSLEKRNAVAVEKIKGSKEKDVAVVYGGMHAAGILKLLEKAGLGCSIVEPIGYQDDEAKLLKTLDDAIQAI